MVELTLTQKLRLKLFGTTPVGYRMKPGWSAPIMHYAFRCKKHGTVINYPSGYAQRLKCPLCLEEKHKYA